ncbi:MAG TPA: S41 family peptidase [Thermoanaerobaculia bacterium]
MRNRIGKKRCGFLPLLFFIAGVAASPITPTPTPAPPPIPPVLAEIDRHVRDEFWDPKWKGVDWAGSVRLATAALTVARDDAERDAIYDRLLAQLDDSHTFRLGAGKLPSRNWATAGLRIGQEGDGYAVKGVIPGSPAEQVGIRVADRILAVGAKAYGKERVNFRDLFLVFQGPVGSSVDVTWKPAGSASIRTTSIARTLEESGDALVWKSARVIRRGGRTYGYVRLWGLSSETALALVDLLQDRRESSRVKPELSGFADIDGLLVDVRGNSGGYDPGILATFLKGRWISGSFLLRSREGASVAPPPYDPLPTALLVNSGTASAGESLALQFRRHGIGTIVGETTAGMASGGAFPDTLSDHSTLWISRRAIEDFDGSSYEGRGVMPDVAVSDLPPARDGEEEAIVEAGIKALAGGKR